MNILYKKSKSKNNFFFFSKNQNLKQNFSLNLKYFSFYSLFFLLEGGGEGKARVSEKKNFCGEGLGGGGGGG